MKGSPFLVRLDNKMDQLKEDYKVLVEGIPEIGKWSFDQFVDATLLAGSRNFGVKVNKKKTNLIVPLSDMFNHAKPYHTKWSYSDERNGFIMTANVDIKKD